MDERIDKQIRNFEIVGGYKNRVKQNFTRDRDEKTTKPPN